MCLETSVKVSLWSIHNYHEGGKRYLPKDIYLGKENKSLIKVTSLTKMGSR